MIKFKQWFTSGKSKLLFIAVAIKPKTHAKEEHWLLENDKKLVWKLKAKWETGGN